MNKSPVMNIMGEYVVTDGYVYYILCRYHARKMVKQFYKVGINLQMDVVNTFYGCVLCNLSMKDGMYLKGRR